MNKSILMGRLVRDPEIRYSQGASPVAVANYTLAVNRRFKQQGQPDVDFINIVAIGKNGEFAEDWLHKGNMIQVVGRIQVRSWEDNEGKKRYATEVVAEEHYFCGGKSETQNRASSNSQPDTSAPSDGFYPIDESVNDDDLPF
ncbi:single-stranded DNA-binding protein [Anaerotignum sp. MB30-C6]|uniref:single-stranded DNA-binding protein n=1 Tax=Anaerotignum sp. MB30-C6 TaxID=3070814 RepID=UPI0027DC2FDC|nr:single-stranded DNA-binding protein [Anaerotignum sp. MB30-C6]WMI80936.1 single-stranded DNA-binding protein [Anaerotignum sp. MB30-C6]